MKWLEEQLVKQGATPAQLKSSTVKMVEKAIVSEAGFVDKAALDVMERLAATFEEAKSNTAELKAMVDAASRKADTIVSGVTADARKEVAKLEEQVSALKRERDNFRAARINDSQIVEAVKAYRAVLIATKDVFGEAMTEEIMKKAIKAAGFVAYRGVMGPK